MKDFENYLLLVKDVIGYYKSKYSYLGSAVCDDIEQESYMAVFHAMKLYDESLGSFKSYASQWIRTYVYDYLNKVHCVISINREIHRKIRTIKKCFEEHPQASIEDVSLFTGLSVGQVHEYLRGISKVSLDSYINDDEDTAFIELIPDDSGVDVIQSRIKSEVMESIKSLLSDKDQDILFSYYGIGRRQLKQSELAEKYNISHQAISKQIKQILSGLRVALNGQYVY